LYNVTGWDAVKAALIVADEAAKAGATPLLGAQGI
jgi:hypothetical protein